MELLAILSTIILVATIATLILAVASYILYKVRERRSAAIGAHTQKVPQPYLLTAPATPVTQQPLALPPAFIEEQPLPEVYVAPEWENESAPLLTLSLGDALSFDNYTGDGFSAPRPDNPTKIIHDVEEEDLEWL